MLLPNLHVIDKLRVYCSAAWSSTVLRKVWQNSFVFIWFANILVFWQSYMLCHKDGKVIQILKNSFKILIKWKLNWISI